MDATSETRIRRALDLWSDFPIHQHPRPLVLNGRQVLFNGGFSGAEAKPAFLSGAIVSDVPLPPGVLDLLRLGSSQSGSFTGSPLHIVAVTAVRDRFSSDRGRRLLPAWQLTVDGATQPFIVCDPSVVHWWPQAWDAAMPREEHGPSRIHPNGTLVTYTFSGKPPRGGRYASAEVFETPHAVHIQPIWKQSRPLPQTMTFDRAGGLHLDVELALPLAHRVLITGTGHPLTVLPI